MISQVGAALVLAGEKQEVDFAELKSWCQQRMAHYMVPTVWRIYQQLPRNALGKVCISCANLTYIHLT